MKKEVMRDVLIDRIYDLMHTNEDIFFISADFGAPALDRLRGEFEDRFVNVGIAEQNLINIATGLALEGALVYVYSIAPFLSMRAYEQIRTNLAMLSQIRELNVNLIGVGAGLSYDVTGPTHHCLEDICVMRVLPNMMVFSPCDCVTVDAFAKYTVKVKKPKYIRLDGKAQPRVYLKEEIISFEDGFCELRKGTDICLISTGYMTHKALEVAEKLESTGISTCVVDIFMLKPLNLDLLSTVIAGYEHVATIEESFINKGSLDAIVSGIIINNKLRTSMATFGFRDRYVYEVGSREQLHRMNGLDTESIVSEIETILKSSVRWKCQETGSSGRDGLRERSE